MISFQSLMLISILAMTCLLCTTNFTVLREIKQVNSPQGEFKLTRKLGNIDEHHFMSQCPRNITETEIATTLVTQTTVDRLEHLERTCKRWSSSIVAAVYIKNNKEEKEIWTRKVSSFSKECPQLKLIPYISHKDKPGNYPINTLRNIGFDAVETSHVLMIDIDFIPSENLDIETKKAVKRLISKGSGRNSPVLSRDRDQTYSHFHALIVPAYERKFDAEECTDLNQCIAAVKEDEEFMPRTVESLKECVSNNERESVSREDGITPKSKCIVFHSDYYKLGHGFTKSDDWLRDMNKVELRTVRCIQEGYEPYLVIPWCPSKLINHGTHVFKENLKGASNEEKLSKLLSDPWKPMSPYYDERFYGYGKNKVQHIIHLSARGYEYVVMPATGFLTHYPHAISGSRVVFDKKNKKLRQSMSDLMNQFIKELNKKYLKGGIHDIWTGVCKISRGRRK